MAAVSLTILVVDDNEPARYATARLLRHAGFGVLEASTGTEALALLQVEPDVVLLDVNLPDLDGLEVCRRIRRSPHGADVLVVNLTAQRLDPDDRLRGLEAGADAYLTVPIDVHVLVATIRAVVRTRKTARSRALATIGPDLAAVPRDLDAALAMLDEARLAVRARDELLAVVAQELVNPLSTVHLSAEVLRRRSRSLGGARAERLLDNIVRAAEHSHRLVADLVDLAAIEAGTFALERAPYDAADVAREAAEAFAVARGQRLELLVDDAQGLVVECDRRRIAQVFAHLLANAAKFSPDGAVLRVLAVPSAGAAVYVVSDEGQGIAPFDLPRVFDRFFKGRHPQHGGAPNRGAGLGLAIAKGIVAAHGGRLWAESAVGRGSAFRFTVPAGPPT